MHDLQGAIGMAWVMGCESKPMAKDIQREACVTDKESKTCVVFEKAF